MIALNLQLSGGTMISDVTVSFLVFLHVLSHLSFMDISYQELWEVCVRAKGSLPHVLTPVSSHHAFS